MDVSFLIIVIVWFFRALWWIIFLRIIFSWLQVSSGNPITHFIYQTSEQILLPFRKIIPKGNGALGMIDWSPLLALLCLDLLSSLIVKMILMLLG